MRLLKKTVVIFILLLFTAECSYGEKHSTLEDNLVKTAFLYKFLKFVKWEHETALDTIDICLYGESEMFEPLRELDGKYSRKKQIRVTKTHFLNNADSCQLLFISTEKAHQLEKIVKFASQHNILTIGDTSGFAKKGIVINYYLKGNKIAFEINSESAKNSGLSISSKLLRLAKIVSSAKESQ